MASSVSSFPAVTNEEFNLFHSIDRQLYSHLILNLARDPAESMQVMAFWLWLERSGYAPLLVKKLLSWPFPLVSQLADETIMCLKCIESDNFFFAEGDDNLTLLQSLTGNSVISFQHFHENRVGVLRGVTTIVNEVCARTFQDILISHSFGKPSFYHPIVTVPFYHNIGLGSHMGFGVSGNIGHMVGVQCYDPYDLEKQREILNNELGELLSQINLAVSQEENEEVPPYDRTIFLTFSKGYPISETEVRDFFTRQFGDFIEEIYMQKVGPEEQVLYARLVARTASIIDSIVGRDGKLKYSINGKHVWARKYVKKQSKSSPRITTSPSKSTSP